METKTYVVLIDTPRLGRVGTTVQMTPKAAKYWLLGGVIAEPENKTAKKGK